MAFNENGKVQNAWVEYLRTSTQEAVDSLSAVSSIPNVFTQGPMSAEDSPPINPGTPEDVWVYDDGDGTVLGIPKRGTWHYNRRSPGWPELLGRPYKEAIETIISEEVGVNVIFGPAGFGRIKNIDIRRVWLDVDKNGNVAIVPRLG
ncbi:protein MpPR6a [Marchantia polymorpha subsp. ruderalis]|uniref:Uncharacterized protein n=2 Tax=Marchantia polymorpha TaxID=3197 RepID=A0A176VTZ5_MARPO|nr:hypothetical protein AXG93_1528s1190 [Marchantia polymorpha subsp. ruderalis]PTQ47516.1 hypothetical protein MARPO_0008s0258 [Marchantia polymorpha]BBN19317.1 hypothetical protein Mp_8g09630 [Marchantia polymorpha subsp. ruderalis]|eukprot:PTQ47516.1 hypothetical protein MARPO_0008s0258 [Marchantia polymorpha]